VTRARIITIALAAAEIAAEIVCFALMLAGLFGLVVVAGVFTGAV